MSPLAVLQRLLHRLPTPPIVAAVAATRARLEGKLDEVLERYGRREEGGLAPVMTKCRDLLMSVWMFPASVNGHHAELGGLLRHTIEVTEAVVYQTEGLIQPKRLVCVLAAMMHDVGKCAQYTLTPPGGDGPPYLYGQSFEEWLRRVGTATPDAEVEDIGFEIRRHAARVHPGCGIAMFAAAYPAFADEYGHEQAFQIAAAIGHHHDVDPPDPKHYALRLVIEADHASAARGYVERGASLAKEVMGDIRAAVKEGRGILTACHVGDSGGMEAAGEVCRAGWMGGTTPDGRVVMLRLEAVVRIINEERVLRGRPRIAVNTVKAVLRRSGMGGAGVCGVPEAVIVSGTRMRLFPVKAELFR